MDQNRITKAIRTQVNRTNEMEHASPLFLTSSFCFDDAESMRAAFADESDDNIYSRFSNPSVKEFVDKICILEGAEDGFATARLRQRRQGIRFLDLVQGPPVELYEASLDEQSAHH